MDKWTVQPIHWFFIRILIFFLWACIILTLALIHILHAHGRMLHWFFHIFWILLIIIILGSLVLRRMFGPLRWLLHGVQEISNGNLDFQFQVQKYHGEIWCIAHQFNLMVQHIKNMIHSKEQLLLGVSHELRSPLTRMNVALAMLPEGKLKNSIRQDLSEMETMLEEILITEQLKNNNGQLKLSQIHPLSLVRQLAVHYKSRKPKIRVIVPTHDIIFQADEERVAIVCRNVIENALKYSSHQKKPVKIFFKETRSHVKIYIQDYGIGIPQEEQERVFEPFYRVDKSRTKTSGGYGLGLSLCFEIMRAHGGTIELKSSLNHGTLITLTWPKYPSNAVQKSS